jgi:hypothetical protein
MSVFEVLLARSYILVVFNLGYAYPQRYARTFYNNENET